MSHLPTSPPLSELSLRQVQWILAGAELAFSTMPGQTIFIAQFNTALRETFGLSHGAFGGLYTIATLTSAFCPVWAGALADKFSARRLALSSIVGLALVACLMSSLHHLVLLGVALALLNFWAKACSATSL